MSTLVLSLREGASLADGVSGLVVRRGEVSADLGPLSAAAAAALRRLPPPGEREDRLTEAVTQADDLGGALDRLTRRGLLLRTACQDGERLATLAPTSPQFAFTPRTTPPGCRYMLSRFAYIRQEAGEMLLESPLAHCRLILHDGRAAALAHALARPVSVEELAGRTPSLSAEGVGGVLSLFAAAGVVCRLGADGASPEDGPALLSWEFHDLLFHSRSRFGRHDAPMGSTYRLADRLPPPPVLKPAPPTEAVALSRPDLDQLQREDPPFARVQEARRSIREYGAAPITERQLGEFLYRVARVADYMEQEIPTAAGDVPMAFAPRPYPAGGALYELELYPVVAACAGLAPGLYYHDAGAHRLHQLCGRTAEMEQLLTDAARSAGMTAESLQILIIVAARFQRVAWKYASIAYALTLKHVGVLYQTMYLAATAMELAPCALGAGNSDLFPRAAGTDYYAETSVGEFLLGSRRPLGPI